MKEKQNRVGKPGYIIVLTLMIISMVAVIVSIVFTKGSTYVPYLNSAYQREQAKLLALGGVAIGSAQLAQMSDQKREKNRADGESDKQTTSNGEARALLRTVLPHINRWQTIDFQQKEDGFEGQVRICLVSEDGKINLNQLYDDTGSVKKAWREALPAMFKTIAKQARTEDLYGPFQKFMKERQGQPLEDVTELFAIKEFEGFAHAVDYQPPTKDEPAQAGGGTARPFYLTDIFTVHGSHDTLEPWLFSDSILGVLGMTRVRVGDEKQRVKLVDTVMKQFATQAVWKRDWGKTLQQLYGVELQSLPKYIESVLNPKVEPQVFSIIAHGIAGDVVQRVRVIVQRTPYVGKKGERTYEVTIKRVYWS